MIRQTNSNRVIVSRNRQHYIELFNGFFTLSRYGTGVLLHKFEKIKNITNGSFSRDGMFCVLKSSTGRIIVINILSHEIIYDHETRAGEGIDPIFDFDGNYIIDGYWSGIILIHRLLDQTTHKNQDFKGKKITQITMYPKSDNLFIECMDRKTEITEFYSTRLVNGSLIQSRMECKYHSNYMKKSAYDYIHENLYAFEHLKGKLTEKCTMLHRNDNNKKEKTVDFHFQFPPLFRVLRPFIDFEHRFVINIYNNCVFIHNLDEFTEVYRYDTNDEMIRNVYVLDRSIFIMTNKLIFDVDMPVKEN